MTRPDQPTGGGHLVPETAVTETNLTKLDSQRLARILAEHSMRNRQLRRRLQTELAAQRGVDALAEDIRGRLELVVQPGSRHEVRQKTRHLVNELEAEREAIVDTLAARAPDAAFDLLLCFLEMHAEVMACADDADGRVAHVFYKACCDLGAIAESARVLSSRLAHTIVHLILDDPFGLYDGLITTLSDALGDTGLAILGHELLAKREAILAGTESSTAHGLPNVSVVNARLREVYECREDVDGLLSTYTSEELKSARVAASLVRRLTDAERPQEAMQLLDAAPPSADTHFFGEYDWTSARIDVLEALGDWAEAQELRLSTFPATPSAAHLKAYITRLAGVEDDAATDQAARAFLENPRPDRSEALAFLVSWLVFQNAARLVRVQTGDGVRPQRQVLIPASRCLEEAYPLVSVALRRALIEDALTLARASRYPDAAQNVRELEALDATIHTYEAFETHEQFMTRLRTDHPRKRRFWSQLEGADAE
ncbi:DUF6880 family protein [Rhodovibrio salinarum]|uniref:Uncharacterized protein n=1 Tax=Rhodovibrio salinarum TaxID=1087 RepID=A0A934UYS6_9PROT|nr:DUF6880 family protein [Rhodovibrio salinarum]MBK1696327.1 hypothetical protein [Rhodovibrio salinarum]